MKLEEAAQKLDMKLEEALDRVVNKRELLIRLLNVYVQEDSMDVAKEAVEKKDYKKVETTLHSMKGAGASLGLDVMAQACHQVVAAVREGRYEEVEPLFENVQKQYAYTKEVIEELEA